jgi:hypothetical protein
MDFPFRIDRGGPQARRLRPFVLWKAIFQLRGASEQTSLNMKSSLRNETVPEYGRWYLLSVGNALGL